LHTAVLAFSLEVVVAFFAVLGQAVLGCFFEAKLKSLAG
jgi:hypothetical protein